MLLTQYLRIVWAKRMRYLGWNWLKKGLYTDLLRPEMAVLLLLQIFSVVFSH